LLVADRDRPPASHPARTPTSERSRCDRCRAVALEALLGKKKEDFVAFLAKGLLVHRLHSLLQQ
jgi:hypothetical protein